MRLKYCEIYTTLKSGKVDVFIGSTHSYSWSLWRINNSFTSQNVLSMLKQKGLFEFRGQRSECTNWVEVGHFLCVCVNDSGLSHFLLLSIQSVEKILTQLLELSSDMNHQTQELLSVRTPDSQKADFKQFHSIFCCMLQTLCELSEHLWSRRSESFLPRLRDSVPESQCFALPVFWNINSGMHPENVHMHKHVRQLCMFYFNS